MFWWKEIAGLKQRLQTVEDELSREQGKAARLSGFLSRLQLFEITPTGHVPRREFSEALIDSVGGLLGAQQVVLFQTDAASLELFPAAGRGVSPDVLARTRVPVGKTLLGQAAQGLKPILQNSATVAPRGAADEDLFFSAPYLLLPLVSQARCTGLLLIAKPQDGSFSPQAQELAQLFARQAALAFENYQQREALDGQGEHMVDALMRAVEAKDSGTHDHSHRTRKLVRAMAQEISLPESLIREIEYGAVLHDVGKIGIEESILNKPDKLSVKEYEIIKKHPVIGHRILQPLAFLKQVGAIVLYHQEWYNGDGYPEGLAGEEIPLGARIVQIIDAWDAMTSDRPYRQALPKSAAITELRRQEGTQFDPKLVELFLRVIDRLEREGVATTEKPRPTAILDHRP